MDFELENVLVSLHSLKTMGLVSIIFKEWRVTRTFSYTSFIWFFLSGGKSVQVFFYHLFIIFVLLLVIQLSRGESWDPINRYNPVSTQDLDFQLHMLSFFEFGELRRQLIVYLVDIGGTVDHQCLNFLLIIPMMLHNKYYY